MHMVFDRGFGDEELSCNCSVRQPRSHQAGHLELPRREAIKPRIDPGGDIHDRRVTRTIDLQVGVCVFREVDQLRQRDATVTALHSAEERPKAPLRTIAHHRPNVPSRP